MSRPSISVIMATHNRADKFLSKAIESVVGQSIDDWELIVVDDGSTDNTEEVVKSFKDKRIKYIKREEASGTHCRPLNEGIAASKGEYIAYLDDDNEYYPFHLEVLAKTLDNNPELDVAYCDMIIDYGDGKLVPGIAIDFDPQFLIRRNYIDTSEVMHRRDVVFAVGGWNEKVKRFTDWNLWARMAKWGARFQRVPIAALKYNAHGGDTQSKRTEVKSWFDSYTGMTMFEPTFDPAGDYIFCKYLEPREKELSPKVAIFTMTYDRLEYTKRMWHSMHESASYPFDWYVLDQGSSDDTPAWLDELAKEHKNVFVHKAVENMGITKGSNLLLDKIAEGDYQIVIKIDNDCEFMTVHWLSSLVDLWKRNHMIYVSPYPEGLVHHPGGGPRVGYSSIGPYPLEVTTHIGGLCAFIDARAYKDFRWTDQFKHGDQDSEASMAFRGMSYMPCYMPIHRVFHMDTTQGQYEKFPEYFERRKKEKTEVA